MTEQLPSHCCYCHEDLTDQTRIGTGNGSGFWACARCWDDIQEMRQDIKEAEDEEFDRDPRSDTYSY